MIHSELLDAVIGLVRDAGNVIMEIYCNELSVRAKSDESPVTQADELAEALIVAGLSKLTPQIPIVAEELVAAGHVPDIPDGCFWLVDALDGTKEFIQRNGEFTVNVGLVEGRDPVLGIVFAPSIQRLFAGVRDAGAYVEDTEGRRSIRCRKVPEPGLTVIGSRSHGDAAELSVFLAGRAVASSTSAGSSLKFCVVAAGEADLYPRLGRTMEWDTAAGHAILVAAGGQVCRVDDGRPLSYGKHGFENPHFVATGLPS